MTRYIPYKALIVIMYTSLLFGILYLPRIISSFSKELTIYTFIDTVRPETLREFEAMTGVKVNAKYYDSIGEFLAELKARQGKGYDVLLLSDDAVPSLIKKEYVAKLDYAQLPNASMIDERLLGYEFDPNNEYSLPFAWGVYGIGYNKEFFPELSKDNVSWKMIFEPHRYGDKPYKIATHEFFIDSLFTLSLYMFGHSVDLTDHFDVFKKVFIDQKPHVISYSAGNYGYYLRSGLVQAVFVEAFVMKQIMEEDDRFAFAVPVEGSILGLENCMISKKSTNKDVAHQFINFLLTKEQSMITWLNGFNPANKTVYKKLDRQFTSDPAFFPDSKVFNTLHIPKRNISKQKIEKLLLDIKLA